MATLLHPALSLLLRKQFKARWRKLIRGTKTLKGKLGFLAVLAVFAMSVAPMALLAVIRESSDDPASVRSMIASGLFLLAILNVLGQGQDTGVVFSPAEVDFLFPAPFRRRDLLIYRLLSLGFGALFSALFFSLLAVAYAPHWFFAFLGFALAVQFIQLVSLTLGLAISIVGQAAYTRGRKIGLAIVAIVVVAGFAQVGSDVPEEGVIEWTRLFASTAGGRVLLAPFQIFAGVIAAEHFFPGLVAWASLAVVVNATLVAFILRLDVNFLERSAATSQKAYLKLQRLRSGQGWANLSKPSGARWRLPMPGRWRGAGPIAWRQLIGALRGARGIVYFLLIMAAFGAMALGRIPTYFSAMAVGPLAMMTITLLPQMLRCDFRGDLDNMEMLKTLPMSSSAIAAGELIAPTVFAGLLQLPLILLLGPFGHQWKLAGAICAFVPNTNLLIFGLENLIFLWYPQRMSNAAELAGAGRRMLTSIAKVLMVGVVAGLAALAGTIVYFLAGSWPAALAAAWLVVSGCALALIPILARAFERFDPGAVPAD